MEFVETPTFWCTYVDRAACNNFSTRTVELRPSEHMKILHFSFFLSFPFPFLFYKLFPFLSFFLSFFAFLSFPFLISFPIIYFSPYFLLIFFSLFGATLTVWVKGGSFLLITSCHLYGPCFSPIISYFIISFMTSYNMWLNESHTIK